MLACLKNSLPIIIQVNITALLSTDADAPVIKLKSHKQPSISNTRVTALRFIKGKREKSQTNPT